MWNTKHNLKQHESYGLVRISRSNGSSMDLYGSDIENYTTFTLSIKRSESYTSGLGTKTYAPKDELIEVMLSPAQFTELITTMNIGSGVPCTIRSIEGKKVQPAPRDISDFDIIKEVSRESSQESIDEVISSLDAFVSSITEKGIAKKHTEEILRTAKTLKNNLTKNQDFYLKRLDDVANEVKQKVKIELDALVSTTAHNLGIKSIKELGSINVSESKKLEEDKR